MNIAYEYGTAALVGTAHAHGKTLGVEEQDRYALDGAEHTLDVFCEQVYIFPMWELWDCAFAIVFLSSACIFARSVCSEHRSKTKHHGRWRDLSRQSPQSSGYDDVC